MAGGGLKKGRKTVAKVQAVFQCSSQDCKRTWMSTHGWVSSRRRFLCETCKRDGKVVKYVDEACELDNYHCLPCNNFWQVIHGDENVESKTCNVCSLVVEKEEGTQIRNGTHYWYKCKTTRGCGDEWEDFLVGGECRYTQRCICGNAGEMLGVSKGRPFYSRRRSISGERRRNKQKHAREDCDMCKLLWTSGIAPSCTTKYLVVSELLYLDSGDIVEMAIHAEEGSPRRGRDDKPKKNNTFEE